MTKCGEKADDMYEEMIKALRCTEHSRLACNDCYERDCCANSGRGLLCEPQKLMNDAADAIERLTAEVDRKDKAIQGLLKQIGGKNEQQ